MYKTLLSSLSSSLPHKYNNISANIKKKTQKKIFSDLSKTPKNEDTFYQRKKC